MNKIELMIGCGKIFYCLFYLRNLDVIYEMIVFIDLIILLCLWENKIKYVFILYLFWWDKEKFFLY